MSNTAPLKEQVQQRQNTLEAFRLLADTIPTLCWMADATGFIYWYNKRWYEYTGLSPEETKSPHQWEAAHHPSDHYHILEKWQEAIETKEPFELVVSLKGADGVFRPFLSHIVPSKDEQGNVTGWLGIKTDISKLRAANKALKRSESKFKTLAETMPQMAFIADEKGNITYYNKPWYNYVSGEKGTEGWGWKDKGIHHPDDIDRTLDAWNDSLKTGKEYEIEYRLRRHDGQYRWHLGRAKAVRDDDGKVISWIGTNTDIHDQKRQSQNEKFLLEGAKELSKSLDYKQTLKVITNLCIPDIADWCSIDLLNENGDFEQVAVAHADPKKATLVKKFRSLTPLRADDNSTSVSRVTYSGEPEFYPVVDTKLFEKAVKNPEDLQFLEDLQLCSIIVVPVVANNKPAGAITFATSESSNHYSKSDLAMAEELAGRISLAITNALLFEEVQHALARSRQFEQELVEEKAALESRVESRTKQLQITNEGLQAEVEHRKEIEKELVRSNQELQDFAYVASHDLQEPLRKIQAFGDILQSEYGDKLSDGSEYLSRMHAAATRMSQLIEDLLTFSRVTTKAPNLGKVDLNEVVADVLSDIETRITRTKGTVTVGELPEVLADQTHMRQLFQNLIANALKFNREGVPPVVTVTCSPSEKSPGMSEIIVEDNGIGFDKKYADRIFGVFQRLHGRNVYEGTGIGLAVCRKIVAQYGGTIAAEGRPGKGAKFIINLPVATEETDK